MKEVRDPSRSFGLLFELALLKAKRYVFDRDQNFTILVAGRTGSGKSTVDLHMWSVLEGELDLDRFGFDVKGSARAYDVARKLGRGALFTLDELKLYARKSMSEYNTDFIDLLFSIRGENLIMAGNAPSARSVDKLFIEEALIDVLIFIHKSQARLLWIPFDRLMDMLKDHGNISYSTLQDKGEFYAEFDTYFSRASPEMWSQYSIAKREGMKATGDKFVEKYAHGERFSLAKTADMLNVHEQTLRKYIVQGIADKSLPDNLKAPSGRWSIPEDFVDELRLYLDKHSGMGGVSS